MTMLQLPIKFTVGDKAYFIEKVKPNVPCEICESKGTITYNNKDMRCPECMGIGSFVSKKAIHLVSEEPAKISSIKVTVDSEESMNIKYKIIQGTRQLNRSEENLFLTKEGAEARCKELNLNVKAINVSDIVIQNVFAVSHPNIDKVQDKLSYYKDNKKFRRNIRVDKNNVLQDGYIDYLICKTLNINEVNVTII